MKHYLHEVDEVFEAVNSTPEGLSSAEAEKRLQENGKNKLAEAKKVSMFSRFIDQLKDPMIIILLVAAVISAVTEFVEHDPSTGMYVPTDSIIILVVVLINAILGVIQESKPSPCLHCRGQYGSGHPHNRG